MTVYMPAVGGGAKSPLTLTAHPPGEVPLTLIGAPSQNNYDNLFMAKNPDNSDFFSIGPYGTIYQNIPSYPNQGEINSIYLPAGCQTALGCEVMIYPPGPNNSQGLWIDNTYNGVDVICMVLRFTTQVNDIIQFQGQAGAHLGGFDHLARPYLGPAPSFGGGTGPMMFIGNCTAAPSSAPSGGGVLYVATNGSLHYRGPTTDTQIAPA